MASILEDTLHPRQTGTRPENASCMEPSDARSLFRKNAYDGYTSGFCSGYAQANVLILPKELADDFEELCRQNSGAFPLLYRSKPGEIGAPVLAADSDIRTDLPQYVVYHKGCNMGNLSELKKFESTWNYYVSFYLGCSSTFDTALVKNGIELKNVLDIPMYTSNISLCPVGPFKGKVIVSMRMIAKHQMEDAFMISSQYPDHHGAPIHIGDPSRIGISGITVLDGYIPMFWACGFTVQEAIASAKPQLTFSHYPGSMFITDVKVQPIPVNDDVEIVQLSRLNDPYFASVINRKSLAIFEELEKALLVNEGDGIVTRLLSKSDLLKATLALSHAGKVVVSTVLNQRGELYGLSGTLAICQALLTLRKEVTLITDKEDEKLYKLCIQHMVETGVFKMDMFPAIVHESKFLEMCEKSSPACDCIVLIGQSCHGTKNSQKIDKFSQPIDKMLEMIQKNPHMTIIRMSYKGGENGMGNVYSNLMRNTLVSTCMTTEHDASGDYHIIAEDFDWGGYALACGLYVVSTSPFHWRYRNHATNANKMPQFSLYQFLPTAEQINSLRKYLTVKEENSVRDTESDEYDQLITLEINLKKLSNVTALASGVHV